METKRQEGQTQSHAGQEWENTEKVDSSDIFKKTEIETLGFFEEYENFVDSGKGYIIDIFPKRVPEESKCYEEVEQHFLSDIYNSFTKKCLSVVMKLMCFYPYENIVVNYYDKNDEEVNEIWEAYSWYRIEYWRPFIEEVFSHSGRVHFLFKSGLLLVLYCDDLIANVYISESGDREMFNLLETLTTKEGLYLKQN